MESLVELFVHVDDVCQAFLPKQEQHMLSSGQRQRRQARTLSISEVMTILNPLSSIPLSQFQGLLLRARTASLAFRISWLGQLHPFC